MRLFAVLARPALYSKSPQLHNAGFAALGLDAHYARLTSSTFADALAAAKEIGISGLNISSPFKEEAFRLVDSSCPISQKLRAVNTVLISDDGTTKGFNTDSFGAVGALISSDVKINKQKVLVLGAGGAARAAIYGLLENGAQVAVSNRSIDKAKMLRETFGVSLIPFDSGALTEAISEYSIIISTIGDAKDYFNPESLTQTHTILDATYSHATWIQQNALKYGAKLISGKEWLLHQGIHCFGLFCNQDAPVEIMRKALDEDRTNTRLVLTGLMGSGKTLIAKEISKISSLEVIDIDESIAANQGIDIYSIFQKFGEEIFRSLEADAIAKLPKDKECVISTGGGAIISEQNRKLLAHNSTVVWLWTPIEELSRRLKNDLDRPLLGSNKEASLRELFSARRDRYFSSADLIVSTAGRTIEEISHEIWYEYCKARKN